MFSSKLKVGAIAVAGLAVAGLAAVAAGIVPWTQQSLPPVQVHAPETDDGPEVLPEPQRVDGKKALDGPGHVEPEKMLAGALARLHHEAVTKFTSSPDFGMRRMPVWPAKVAKEWKIPWWSPGELDKETPLEGRKDLDLIHQDSLKDFASGKVDVPMLNVNALLNGTNPLNGTKKADVVPSGRQKNWEMKSLDLVGLIKHPEPVVYVSEKLPDMKELKGVPTRPLDFFEFAGLEALKKGDNVFARGKDETIRMMGALRAGKQCLSCHDNQESDLLGAFSYTLRVAEYKLTHKFPGSQFDREGVQPLDPKVTPP